MKKVSFPQMGDYSVPIYYLLSHVLKAEIFMPPKITNQTVELGCKYSPDFVCMPFKYTLGTFLECLENKTNVLIQLGGGCRYGYYNELQEQILKDLGYSFDYISLVTEGHADMREIKKKIKEIDPKFSIIKSIRPLYITYKMIRYMDKIDDYIRKNIGFECNSKSFISLKEKMLQDFSKTKGLFHLRYLYFKYSRLFHKLPLKKGKRLKVGIIGELYTIMEPAANYDLEYMLANYGIEVTRFTNASYLLFQKKKKVKNYLKTVGKYAKNRLGADALDNIGRMIDLANQNYDGVIHIKSTFCTPEIGVMPILRRVSKDYSIPILFFSFDSSTSKVGLETRIEAFYDMIEMRRKSEL